MGKFAELNTLRNQILLGFMLVMVVVLASVGLFAYNQVSVLLRNNAEKHIQQTAAQATGKLDVLLRQVDSFTAQVATNAAVQSMLERIASGETISFQDRQIIQREVRKSEAYTTGVRSIELYTSDYRRLVPLTDESLRDRVSDEWIHRVDEGKGQLVWLGMDERYPGIVIAMRRVRLMDRSFSQAGYVMVQVDKHYFELTESRTGDDASTGIEEYLALVDEKGGTITSDFGMEVNASQLDDSGSTVVMDGDEFIKVQRRSEATGWSIIMLTPVRYATEGISVLRTAIIVSVMVGGILFLILSFILSTMITRPILNLIRAMRSARLGTLKPIPVTSKTLEINELNHTYNQMVASLNDLIEVVYQKEIIQSRTELKALQAQINPHFLFNTLEAFYWALEEKGEEELARVVVAMSGLFRYVISRADEEEWVTIGDELDHAERYLTIMDMRMLDRLSWTIEADETCRKVPIPKLLIQPLVENAILHGVEQRIGPGTVTLRVMPATGNPGYTRIEVADDGPGMNEGQLKEIYDAFSEGYTASVKGNGIGLANVQKRLLLYFEEETGGLTIKSEQSKGTVMAFEIPSDDGRS
ncbi:sensor histidine kinase [Paenibacillus sp. LHD-117]|uniref:sensor histidine kinase n=1 Tax=Paenibacillus sp. LHD-117 TaxID=3071412 RepID=UPI0027DF1A7F|nr:sensor histidine kinase [Paenibacillus sp. LHD-117]MDQ6419430.1 sensor histidine kinase [Paenibacillus sp. LHD-117]